MKDTKYPADRVAVLVDLIQPPLDVVERLDACHVVDNYHTVCAPIVAEMSHR